MIESTDLDLSSPHRFGSTSVRIRKSPRPQRQLDNKIHTLGQEWINARILWMRGRNLTSDLQKERGLFSPFHKYFIQDIDSETDSDKAEYRIHIDHEIVAYCYDSDIRQCDSKFFLHCFVGFRKGLITAPLLKLSPFSSTLREVLRLTFSHSACLLSRSLSLLSLLSLSALSLLFLSSALLLS